MLGGVVAAFVGFSSSFAVVLTGLTAQGATARQAGSGLLALCLGMIVGILALSFRYRMPITLAWSTPGAALLAATRSPDPRWSAAIGVFLFVAVLTALTGLWPWLAATMAKIPSSVASAMLAGVLIPICATAFTTLAATPLYVAPILLTWLVAYAVARRWAVPLALLAALVVVALTIDQAPGLADVLPSLEWTTPTLDPGLLLTLGVPLFLVNIASQYAPGVAVMSSFGYRVPWRPTMLVTAGVSAAAAPFGGHAVNLAAISAALAASDDVHPDRDRRWIASVSVAGTYVFLALLSTAAAFVLTHAPKGLIITVGALALLGPLGSALERCLADPADREAAIITVVVTASGLTLFGAGAAFWGLAFGLLVRTVLRRARRPR